MLFPEEIEGLLQALEDGCSDDSAVLDVVRCFRDAYFLNVDDCVKVSRIAQDMAENVADFDVQIAHVLDHMISNRALETIKGLSYMLRLSQAMCLSPAIIEYYAALIMDLWLLVPRRLPFVPTTPLSTPPSSP